MAHATASRRWYRSPGSTTEASVRDRALPGDAARRFAHQIREKRQPLELRACHDVLCIQSLGHDIPRMPPSPPPSTLSAGALPGARHLAAYNHPLPNKHGMTVIVCMCALHRPHWHIQERRRWGGRGGGENPARPFPRRRRTVAASFVARPIRVQPATAYLRIHTAHVGTTSELLRDRVIVSHP